MKRGGLAQTFSGRNPPRANPHGLICWWTRRETVQLDSGSTRLTTLHLNQQQTVFSLRGKSHSGIFMSVDSSYSSNVRHVSSEKLVNNILVEFDQMSAIQRINFKLEYFKFPYSQILSDIIFLIYIKSF